MKIHQTVYKAGYVVVSDVLHDEPIFCKIQYVFCTENQVVYLAVNHFLSVEYYPHFHSYVMSSTNHLGPIRLLKVDDLYDFHTYKLFQSFDCSLRHLHFICPKYNLLY